MRLAPVTSCHQLSQIGEITQVLRGLGKRNEFNVISCISCTWYDYKTDPGFPLLFLTFILP
jgi:hypothetical protein